MKKTGILLILATFSLDLLCQQFSNVNNDSTYSYIWDSETQDWAGNFRHVRTYGTNSNIGEDIGYRWDSETDDWAGDFRFVYIYNANGIRTETVYNKWDSETDRWKNIERWVYMIDANSIDANWDKGDCIVYPNPTSGMLIIETKKIEPHSIEITSLNGQLILNKEVEGTSHQLDLSSFRKGVYLITVRSKDFVTTRKVVKLP